MNTALKMDSTQHKTVCSSSSVCTAKVTQEEFDAAIIAVRGKKSSKRSAKWEAMVEKSLAEIVEWPESL